MKPNIVVVDDEPAIVEAVIDALEDAGIAAEGCQHGAQAQWCIRRTQPDAIILDVQMPVVDGVELFEYLRADPKTSAIPVIFCTANADKLRSRLPDFRAQGATLLNKPFQIDKLLSMVENTLGGFAA